MAMTIAHTRSAARRGVFPSISAVYATWKQRRALASLDARRLADIGLTEGQALRETLRPVWDRRPTA